MTAAIQPIDSPLLNGTLGKPSPQEYARDVQAKYQAERTKRVKSEGLAQYVDLFKSDRFKHYAEDPWVDRSIPPQRPKSDHCRVLILGSGYGALLYAVRFIEAGFKAEDILFVDSAGGFGGTWYWNRYPGLMCDVESYIYMPLLEETGYMPKHRYAYGPELRAHADRIADKWGLSGNAIFSSTIRESIWDEDDKEWKTKISLDRFDGEPFTVKSEFIVLAAGVLNTPKIPSIPGIEGFKGRIFHTSRWDYKYTGGSPEDQQLINLKDKRVAIIGTGATAIQAVPALSKWVKELYVFQRTPSAVDERGQRETDPVWFKEVSSKPGWQRARMANFAARMSNYPEAKEDLVNDGWTNFPSYSALIGGPANAGLTPETVGQHIATMHALDFPRQERIRARVDSLVEDPATAQKLKPWYAGWCKRPCFHDEYLQAFNKPNVHLVDTAGAGVERITADALVFDGVEYPVDCLVMSTGFVAPSAGTPGSRAGVNVVGRNGLKMDDKWERGVATLHGFLTRDLPNLFFPGPNQTGATANFTMMLDIAARHCAYMLGEALKRAGGKRFVVEPTHEGEEGWTMQIMPQAISYAVLMGCTPSYLNSEGEIEKEKSMEEKMKGARAGTWTKGILDFQDQLEKWEREGDLKGLEIKAAA